MCIYEYTYIYIYVCVYMYMLPVRTYMKCIYTCIYINIPVYICIYIYVYITLLTRIEPRQAYPRLRVRLPQALLVLVAPLLGRHRVLLQRGDLVVPPLHELGRLRDPPPDGFIIRHHQPHRPLHLVRLHPHRRQSLQLAQKPGVLHLQPPRLVDVAHVLQPPLPRGRAHLPGHGVQPRLGLGQGAHAAPQRLKVGLQVSLESHRALGAGYAGWKVIRPQGHPRLAFQQGAAPPQRLRGRALPLHHLMVDVAAATPPGINLCVLSRLAYAVQRRAAHAATPLQGLPFPLRSFLLRFVCQGQNDTK
mmetsp:Transcript_51804/g.125587  ORF Transcript_51804/g.125587 Transcript_51804/m.125587 type:complete len:304 (-) Transcript_51804:39-950(-)